MAGVAVGRLIFLDEAGVNLAMTRRYARSPRGQRAYSSAPINYGPNVSVLGAIGLRGVVTAMSIDGPIDGAIFRAFVEQFLAPELRPGDVVVMDNLSVHKVTGIEAAIVAAGAELVYLPPYSPDLNPIEACWSKVKAWMRKQAARTRDVLEDALTEAFDRISGHDILGWFKHCGYCGARI